MSRCKPLPEFINGFRVITDLGYSNKRRWFIAECPKCLKHYKNRVDAMKHYKSCGCTFFTPGVSRRLQRIHNSMMARCYNPKQTHYDRYGGSGIFTCDEWKDSKKFYLWSLANGYNDSLTIDRIDNNKGYFPGNCRWVSQLENGRNKRNCITEEMAKQIQAEPWRTNLDELCLKYGIKRCTLKAIKYKQNWKNL